MVRVKIGFKNGRSKGAPGDLNQYYVMMKLGFKARPEMRD